MANIDEIEAQIEQTKEALKSLEAQLASEKGGGESNEGEQDAPPTSEQAAEVMASEEESFEDSVEGRMSPAEEVEEAEASPEVDSVMVGIKLSGGDNESDMTDLYSIVYDKQYDPDSAIDAEKMDNMKRAIEQDPRVAKMAQEEPEKFALYMYGKRS
jgi:hypothetical protein